MARPDAPYLHGTDPKEQRRLSLLNEVLNEAALREMGLRGGERILDLGCGLAQLSRGMARLAGPAGRVVGVEADPAQIAEAVRQAADAGEQGLVDMRQGDAADPPLGDEERGWFDIAHARFVLEHVRDPSLVVRAMVASVRPRGRVILQDDDHEGLRLWPEAPGFKELWSGYIEAFRLNGNDPHVGRKLPSLLHAAGASPTRVTSHFWGGCHGMPTFPDVVENMVGLFEGMREPIIASGAVTADQFPESIAQLRAWSLRPEAVLWYAISWAEGVKPMG